MDMQSLPLPELRDDKHRHKQFNGSDNSNRFRPPKYKARGSYVAVENNNLNRSQSLGTTFCLANNSSQAHAISFGAAADTSSLPADSSACNRSHFELCFERLAKLGEGSFGEVFQVRDRSDGRLYAVKISKQLFRGEQYRAERLEEVRRYEEFSGHENCIRFIRAWEQYDRLFMQMELCRESLEQYLCRCRQIPEERIWHILLDLLRGLKSLHDRNLIHLDIKLDNVLIGEDDETCKLADFGLVIDVDKANSQHATEGDSRYMAPEILQGQFSKAADIFSLGIAMLELACYMDLPSNGPLWHELRQGILPEDFIDKISLELQLVIKSMMDPNPQQRPTTDQLLSHPKLLRMQQRRKSLMTLNQLSKSIRRSRRFVWLKMCNWKTQAYRYLFYVLEFLHIYKPIASSQSLGTVSAPCSPPRFELQLVGSTPITNRDDCAADFLLYDEALDLSSQTSASLINSTPLNHNQSKRSLGSSRKSQLKGNLFTMEQNLTSPKLLDTSSIRRKKLFSGDSDED